jgi:hypothetical protein
MKAEANKMLSNYKVMDGVALTGKLNSVSVKSLDLVPGAIRLNANVRGNIALNVDELNF